jgi:outer membrane protein assembly factor BamB
MAKVVEVRPRGDCQTAGAGPALLIRSVADNSGDAVNVVFNCLVSNCNTFTPAFVGIDNASQSQLWEHDLIDGPFLRLSAIAIAPDNTIYASGVFETGPANNFGEPPTNSLVVAINGSTGQPKFTVPVDPSHSHFTLSDENGNVLESADGDSAATIGPLAVMPDGSVRMLISNGQSSETDIQTNREPFNNPCSPSASQCATSISNHEQLKLLTVQPDGSSSLQLVKTYDFDASGCTPCVDPGATNFFMPGDVIPDGLSGVLAAWTENQEQKNTNQYHLAEHIFHVDGSGGFQDTTLPGIGLVPANLAADPGENLILGENNVAFGVGLQIVAFDVTSISEIWSTPFLSPKGAGLLAPSSDGGLVAAELTSAPFGPADALESFTASGTASLSSLLSTLSEVSVFDTNKLLALSSDLGEMLPGTALPAISGNPAAWLPQGNKATQRAPVPPKITYDKQLVKAGISLINKDVRGTVTVTIKPKSTSSRITFRSTNKARATVSEQSRVDSADSTTVTLRVTGISATPKDKPNGDAHMRAFLSNNPVGIEIPILVIIPTNQTHNVSTPTLTNIANSIVVNGSTATELRTSVDAVATITVKDQFGQILDSVYDGVGVVTEQFSNTTEQGLPQPSTGPALPAIETVITEPDNVFANGIKLDQLEVNAGTALPATLTAAQIQGWQNGTLFLTTNAGQFNNVFSFTNTHILLTGTQTIRVHGYRVTPDFVRTQDATPNNHPPIPYTATDVAVQQP